MAGRKEIPQSALKKEFRKEAIEKREAAKKGPAKLPKNLLATQGRNKGKKRIETLRKEAKQAELREQLAPYVSEVVDKLMQKVREGEVSAIKEYFERMYGKVAVKDDTGKALELLKSITIVNYSDVPKSEGKA